MCLVPLEILLQMLSLGVGLYYSPWEIHMFLWMVKAKFQVPNWLASRWTCHVTRTALFASIGSTVDLCLLIASYHVMICHSLCRAVRTWTEWQCLPGKSSYFGTHDKIHKWFQWVGIQSKWKRVFVSQGQGELRKLSLNLLHFLIHPSTPANYC